MRSSVKVLATNFRKGEGRVDGLIDRCFIRRDCWGHEQEVVRLLPRSSSHHNFYCVISLEDEFLKEVARCFGFLTTGWMCRKEETMFNKVEDLIRVLLKLNFVKSLVLMWSGRRVSVVREQNMIARQKAFHDQKQVEQGSMEVASGKSRVGWLQE